MQVELEMYKKTTEMLIIHRTFVSEHAITVLLALRHRLYQNYARMTSHLHLHKHSVTTYFCVN